jgi:DNA-binding NarL/FixJ family response regulator
MEPDESELKKSKSPLGKKHTFILSSANLHNELLIYVLEKEFACKCSLIEHIDSLPVADPPESNNRLLLIDYSTHDYEKTLADIVGNGQIKISSYIIALHNLQHNMKIEKRALLHGIQGFFYKQDNLKIFLKGIKSLYSGETWIQRDILVRCVKEDGKSMGSFVREKTGLSHREMEILAMVSLGLANEAIAAKLYISPHTVKTHLYNVFKKINVPNRLQAALWAAKHL